MRFAPCTLRLEPAPGVLHVGLLLQRPLNPIERAKLEILFFLRSVFAMVKLLPAKSGLSDFSDNIPREYYRWYVVANYTWPSALLFHILFISFPSAPFLGDEYVTIAIDDFITSNVYLNSGLPFFQGVVYCIGKCEFPVRSSG